MKKGDNKIYRGEGIVYDDVAIDAREQIEGAIILGQLSLYIRNYRKKNDLTQVELANELGVNQVMISKLERGTYNPTLKQLLKISYKLTRSNKIFFDMIKVVSKSLKEDYTYNITDVASYSKNTSITSKKIIGRSKANTITQNNKTKKVVKRKKVCA